MSGLRSIKTIDFHVHIGLKEHWHEWVSSYQESFQSDFYTYYDRMTDPSGFASYLREHGIERAVILPDLCPITTGIVPNEYVLDFCRDDDIYIPFCNINPYMVNHPGQELKKYLDQGARGVKIYPSYNHFYPNDRVLYPLYARAQDEQIPVLVHTGSSIFKGAKIKYSDPLYLDDVAVDFPELTILMAHGGRGFWYEKAFFLSRLHSNLFIEISGLPPQNLLTYFPDLEKNADKFIYGSDWPAIKTISNNIDLIKKLPVVADAIKKILYGNATRILRL